MWHIRLVWFVALCHNINFPLVYLMFSEYSVLSSHYKKYIEILKNMWGNKAGKGPGAQVISGVAEVVGVFILEKKQLMEDLIGPFNYLKGGCNHVRVVGLFSQVTSHRMRGNWRFRLYSRKNFFTKKIIERGCAGEWLSHCPWRYLNDT